MSNHTERRQRKAAENAAAFIAFRHFGASVRGGISVKRGGLDATRGVIGKILLFSPAFAQAKSARGRYSPS
jgi:hypothetical protein